ncbi:MAG: adenylate kinase [Chloroflexota bacterium]|nr:adenylate kinase [Chloroflexota bacterium]
MRRINVVGTSCSGKTTLARSVATRLNVRHVELDALFWGPDWTPVPETTFRQRLAAALAGDDWVADGGYSPVRDLTWSRADTVIWLDYPMRTVIRRWAGRTLTRLRTREEFWPGTGNRERLSHVARRDSLLWWILSTHRRRRNTMAAQLSARPDLRHIRLRSPVETERWLETLPPVRNRTRRGPEPPDHASRE